MSSQTQNNNQNSAWSDVFGKSFTVTTPQFPRTFSYDPFSESYFSDRDDQYFDS